MQKNQQTEARLPLPKWCFVLLGIPTFYVPLAYLAMGAWVTWNTLTGEMRDFPEWMQYVLQPAIYVTCGMWPAYLAWVGFSKRLTWPEKGCGLLVVVFLNMVGMPMFYVFMIRRYLGLEGRTGKRDEVALDRFLKRAEITREQLSPAQQRVLLPYCRNQRLVKWATVPMVPLACLLIYTAVVFIPKSCMELFLDFTPTRVVFVNSESDTTRETVPDPETQRLHVQSILIFGAGAGVAGAMGFFLLLQTAVTPLGVHMQGKVLTEFLKAADSDGP